MTRQPRSIPYEFLNPAEGLRQVARQVRDMVPLVEFRGAMFIKDANQTTADFTTAAAVPFNTEVYNNSGWEVSNQSRLQVAPNVRVVQVGGQVGISLSTTDTWKQLDIRKNGSSAYDGFAATLTDTGATGSPLNVVSGPLYVDETDYFELFLQEESDTSITVQAANSFFWIRALA